MTETAARPSPSMAAPGRSSQPTVVVGFDDQPAGAAALAWAADEAALRGARLRVIHELVGREVPDRWGRDRGAGEIIRRATSRVSAAVTEALGTVERLEVAVTTDPIADELIRESVRADLLVIGSSHARTSSAVLFDAVSRSVVRHAHCPVLLVPAGATSSSVASIVCGVDRSPSSGAALEWAAREAALRGITVLAEQVERPVVTRGGQAQQRLSDWVRAQGVTQPTTILCKLALTCSSTAGELLDDARQRKALLVVGSSERHLWMPQHGVTSRLADQVQVPVVVIPPQSSSQRTRSVD